MNVGFVGLGKLGLPTALAIEAKGHTVFGYDPSPSVQQSITRRKIDYAEVHAQELLDSSSIQHLALSDVIVKADILFVTIQTPHHPRYEGITRLPAERVDFDYSFLVAGMREVCALIEAHGQPRIVVLVSTVLPGTVRRDIFPLLGPNTRFCYNPFFIAMGTVIPDFLKPEFVLFGVEDAWAAQQAEAFYRTIHDAPFFKTTLENAELIKVIYNTFISTKLSFANTVMEMCHKLPGTHADEVVRALGLATDRIISTRYMQGGMGDGGGCHPRDNIALSHLSRRLDLSFDWFENIMMQRERQTEWLADLIEQHAKGRPICLLGKAFKAGTALETGSPSVLLATILNERGHTVEAWDPYIDPPEARPVGHARCYFIGTRHDTFQTFPFESGSVVLDPWRFVQVPDQVELVPIGIGPKVSG